ncbi:MAG: hypothetical protein HYX76_12685 [Acidobacteria bacterium]|nr:hypothetical protein [Acidobacteriota bacterium]
MRQRRLSPAIEERVAAYARPLDAAERLRIQLEAFNREWRRMTADVPFYRALKQARDLPDAFADWDDVTSSVPVTTRAIVQQNGAAMASASRQADFVRATGGSTAEPVRIPQWRTEVDETTPDLWLARGWYGLAPSSRLFLIWGHRHLLGAGVKGWLNGRARALADRLFGYCRFSAYDLSATALRRAADELIGFAPDYVLGYSVALDMFARANLDRADALRALGVRVVVGAAENFPAPDSASMLTAVFGCPVAMEYGSVETGLVAHTDPSGGYRVFWRNYLVEAERVERSEHHRVYVTALYPRAFPLVRYDLGDEIEVDTAEGRVVGIEGFRRVLGRSNDYLPLDATMRVHSEAFAHAVSGHAGVFGYQVRQAKGIAWLALVTDGRRLDPSIEMSIRQKLRRIHPLLGDMPIDCVERLERTVAGKTRTVIRLSD